MRPLLIRRAGEFEKTTFDMCIVVGVFGAASNDEISRAIELAWPSWSIVYFVLMTIAGLAGRIVTWKPDRERTVLDIRQECHLELGVLAAVLSVWLTYALANVVLLIDTGASSTIPMTLGFTIVLACLRRGRMILRDLRRLRKALRNPTPADPPLAEDGER